MLSRCKMFLGSGSENDRTRFKLYLIYIISLSGQCKLL